mmetsp:Transcript_9149/g.22750  ORF Transcript_9149/g.22750 Transcript_9149/m.22750 type:complete len:415 (-) Transcript_9149:1750-2994(-)
MQPQLHRRLVGEQRALVRLLQLAQQRLTLPPARAQQLVRLRAVERQHERAALRLRQHGLQPRLRLAHRLVCPLEQQHAAAAGRRLHAVEDVPRAQHAREGVRLFCQLQRLLHPRVAADEAAHHRRRRVDRRRGAREHHLPLGLPHEQPGLRRDERPQLRLEQRRHLRREGHPRLGGAVGGEPRSGGRRRRGEGAGGTGDDHGGRVMLHGHAERLASRLQIGEGGGRREEQRGLRLAARDGGVGEALCGEQLLQLDARLDGVLAAEDHHAARGRESDAHGLLLLQRFEGCGAVRLEAKPGEQLGILVRQLERLRRVLALDSSHLRGRRVDKLLTPSQRHGAGDAQEGAGANDLTGERLPWQLDLHMEIGLECDEVGGVAPQQHVDRVPWQHDRFDARLICGDGVEDFLLRLCHRA